MLIEITEKYTRISRAVFVLNVWELRHVRKFFRGILREVKCYFLVFLAAAQSNLRLE